jgi:hypothetical protein
MESTVKPGRIVSLSRKHPTNLDDDVYQDLSNEEINTPEISDPLNILKGCENDNTENT